jgi:hypothetical protein
MAAGKVVEIAVGDVSLASVSPMDQLQNKSITTGLWTLMQS